MKRRSRALRRRESYIRHIDSALLAKEINGNFTPTTDFKCLAEVDCILICVPTPLDRNREPDMRYVFNTTRVIAKYLRPGQLIVLESTTYPGTTDGDMRKILEADGMKAGRDFHLAFSPEREDPNNKNFGVRNIPKLVGGYTPACLAAAKALYETIVERSFPCLRPGWPRRRSSWRTSTAP